MATKFNNVEVIVDLDKNSLCVLLQQKLNWSGFRKSEKRKLEKFYFEGAKKINGNWRRKYDQERVFKGKL